MFCSKNGILDLFSLDNVALIFNHRQLKMCFKAKLKSIKCECLQRSMLSTLNLEHPRNNSHNEYPWFIVKSRCSSASSLIRHYIREKAINHTFSYLIRQIEGKNYV